MQDTVIITKRALVISILLSLLIVASLFLYQSLYRQSFIVFCDVGQGDAAYIRLANGYDIVIDAGQSKDVLSCLGKYMPFYDKTIELAVISHPHFDHYGGFIFMKDRYEIQSFVVSPLMNHNKSYTELMDWIETNNVPLLIGERGLQMILPDATIDFLWPPAGYTSQDMNDGSLAFVFSNEETDVLFTGDAGPEILEKIQSDTLLIDEGLEKGGLELGDLEILKVPHHGSKNGLTREFLEYVKPVTSVISVGKKNRFGHPSKEVIQMFEDTGYSYVSTALTGNIYFNLE